MAEYMHKMKALADVMAAGGLPIRDDELIDYILTGLGSAYNSIAASLSVSNVDMTYSTFYSLVLSFEALEAQQSVAEGWSTSANAATRPGPYGNGGRVPSQEYYPTPYGGGRPAGGNGQSGQGHHGGNTGHAGNGCQGGNTDNNGGNGGGGRCNNRWRPRSQLCSNWGHEANKCRNKRFNQDYNTHSGN